jgi:hypothetical protein
MIGGLLIRVTLSVGHDKSSLKYKPIASIELINLPFYFINLGIFYELNNSAILLVFLYLSLLY